MKDNNLSWPMYAHMTRHWTSPTAGLNTINALKRRGLVENARALTSVGLSWVRDFCEKEALSNPYKDGHQIIGKEQELYDICVSAKSIDVYVYRGSHPWVVKGGNGQNPLGVLSPYLWWQLRGGDHKRFRSYSIMGHKGSYGFHLRDQFIKENREAA